MALPLHSRNTFSVEKGWGKENEKKKRKIYNNISCTMKFLFFFGVILYVCAWGWRWTVGQMHLFIETWCLLASGSPSAWVPNCPFLKNETAVQKADMERGEAGGECSYAAVGELGGTTSGCRKLFQRILLPRGNQCLDLDLNNVKIGAVMTWNPCS